MILISVNYNRPDFLEVQIPLMLKNLAPDSIHIVNTGDGNNGAKEIAEQYDCRYTALTTGTKDFSQSHALALNLAYSFNRQNAGIIGILDHDCFPIKPLNILDIIKGHDFYSSNQVRAGKVYPNPCCMFMRSNMVVDFMPCEGMDTAGQLHEVYHNVKQMNIQYMPLYEVYDNAFLHIVKGSNWVETDENERRVKKAFDKVKNFL